MDLRKQRTESDHGVGPLDAVPKPKARTERAVLARKGRNEKKLVHTR